MTKITFLFKKFVIGLLLPGENPSVAVKKVSASNRELLPDERPILVVLQAIFKEV
jgi:hypothetical protein